MQLKSFFTAFVVTMAMVGAAQAEVKLKNATGDKFDLEVKGSSTVKRSLEGNTNVEVGGSAPSVTIIVKDGSRELCQGTFSSGDRVVIKKSGSSYSIEKD